MLRRRRGRLVFALRQSMLERRQSVARSGRRHPPPDTAAFQSFAGRSGAADKGTGFMALNIPLVNEQTPRTFLKMLNLEASQLSLPESPQLMKAMLAAYVVLQAGAQFFSHSAVVSIFYGLASAGVLYGATFYLLRYLKQEEKFVKTLIALAGMGALAALAYIVLHLIVGVALPPPLPTERLARFLLFPIIIWTVFMYAFLFRHVSLRPIPAFVTASLYVLAIEIVLSSIKF
jgi:hypothetical protein